MVLFFREREHTSSFLFFCCNLVKMHKAAAILLMMFSGIQCMRTQSWCSKLSALAVIIAGSLALSSCPAMFVVASVVVVASAAIVAVATASIVVVVVDACFAFDMMQALPSMVGSLMSQ